MKMLVSCFGTKTKLCKTMYYYILKGYIQKLYNKDPQTVIPPIYLNGT